MKKKILVVLIIAILSLIFLTAGNKITMKCDLHFYTEQTSGMTINVYRFEKCWYGQGFTNNFIRTVLVKTYIDQLGVTVKRTIP